jgi:predicted sulfurtransferase
VWPVTEIVTYGFNPEEAPLDMRGTHLSPQEFHNALENPNSVVNYTSTAFPTTHSHQVVN